MTNTSPTSNVRPASQLLRVPGDDTLWKKYSRRHEAPLSFVGSGAVHVLGFAVLWLFGYLFYLWIESPPKPLPIVGVRLQGDQAQVNHRDKPGERGKGDPDGQGDKDGQGLPDAEPQELFTPRPPLTPKEADTFRAVFPNNPELMDHEAVKPLFRLDKEVREQLMKNVNPPPQGDKDGKKKGGRGSGTPGDPDGRAPTNREERMLRWVLMFDTRDGQDYLHQLRDLGAIVAVPVGSDGKEYKFCDLTKRPYQFVDGDLASVNRIWWTDDKPQSVRSLMAVLGFQGRPSHFHAFVPQELEQHLFKIELAYKGLKEEQIFETKFKCVRGADGKYTVKVFEQTRK
jgi:hypothetical protein